MTIDERLRSRILDDLSSHFAQDKLGIDEYEQRVRAVSSARDELELININADILPAARYTRSGATAPGFSDDGLNINYEEAPRMRECVAIFSSSTMQGEFAAPKKIDAVSIFGGVIVDLRKAAIPQDGIQIEAVAIFGGITILLPEGVVPEVNGTGIFGGFERVDPSYNARGPRIQISGAAIFGGVEIKFRK